MCTFTTSDKYGYSVKFSPLIPNYLAVSTNEYFGLTGRGTLFIFKVNSIVSPQETGRLTWQNGLFDVAWSETNPNILITCSGDGLLQLWDLELNNKLAAVFSGHHNEISSVHWSKHRHNQVLTASWDSNVKLWDLSREHSINTFGGESVIVHSAVFSKRSPDLFASVDENGFLKIWDSLTPQTGLKHKVHDSQALSCDWSIYNDGLLATSGSDGFIRGWDIRYCLQPLFQMKNCEHPVKKVLFSPHYSNVLATAGFDFTTNMWDIYNNREPLDTIRNHSGYVYGLDWNLHDKGEIADCSWDKTVSIFTPPSLQKLKHKI